MEINCLGFILGQACRLQLEICNKARVETTYPCVVNECGTHVENIQVAVQGITRGDPGLDEESR